VSQVCSHTNSIELTELPPRIDGCDEFAFLVSTSGGERS
jgi:hypothetical protein